MTWRASHHYETIGWYLHPFIPFTICKLLDKSFGVYTEECQEGDYPTVAFPTLEEAQSWAENEYTKRNVKNG